MPAMSTSATPAILRRTDPAAGPSRHRRCYPGPTIPPIRTASLTPTSPRCPPLAPLLAALVARGDPLGALGEHLVDRRVQPGVIGPGRREQRLDLGGDGAPLGRERQLLLVVLREDGKQLRRRALVELQL